MSNLKPSRDAAEFPELKISVAMCTYNGETYLTQQLRSILDQTLLPHELVACDDGSTDRTLELLSTFAEEAPFPVRIVSNPRRLGSTKNFEKAIGLCNGQVVALCDQDDVWYREKLGTLASLFQSNPGIGGMFSDGDLTAANGERLGVSLWQSFLLGTRGQEAINRGMAQAVFFRRAVVTGATLAFRISLRDKLLPIPTSWVHDGWIAWMLFLNSTLALCPQKLIAYRIHSSQQIGASTSNTSFFTSMIREGSSNYLRRMRLRHSAEYSDTSEQYRDLSRYLQNHRMEALPDFVRHSEAKANFSAAVADAMGRPRLLRLHRIVGQTANYFQYSARPLRLMVRDLIL